MALRPHNANKKTGTWRRAGSAGERGMKRTQATDILAWHTLNTLPDSVAARREILLAVLAMCASSRYADRISVMLVHLERHAAIGSKIQPQGMCRSSENHEE